MTDYYRKQRPATDDVESLVDNADEAETGSVVAELTGCLGALIERLPDDQRRAVALYELEGISQKEIATRESISLSGAKSRVQRGRKSLEALLKACCEFQLDARGNVLDYETTDNECCDEACG